VGSELVYAATTADGHISGPASAAFGVGRVFYRCQRNARHTWFTTITSTTAATTINNINDDGDDSDSISGWQFIQCRC
jgi:hypothetical protein